MAKSKSSSRISSSKNKNLKLKWWYVLPVILVVAVAGYAIVRFSEASTYQSLKTISNGGLNCNGGKVVDKQGEYGKSCNITNAAGVSASASWNHFTGTASNYGPSGNFCATVFFDAGAKITTQSTMVWGGGGKGAATSTEPRVVTKATQGYYEVCDSWNAFVMSYATSDSASLVIKNISGSVTVVRMYVK